jgi:hypothetical protein
VAFKHAKAAAVFFGSTDLSPYLNALDLSVSVDTADTTAFGSSWKTALAGTAGCTVGFGGFYDPTVTSVIDSVGGEDKVLTWFPAGAAALGDRARLANVATSSYAEGSPVGDAVSVAWDVLTDGVVGFGDVIYLKASSDVDVTGTAVNMVAQTTTGAIAHLHLFSISAGEVVDVTIEDSANGTTGWATIGTFAQKAVAGSERIVIAGTVKQYVRVVADVTDNGGTVEFTCAVALART